MAHATAKVAASRHAAISRGDVALKRAANQRRARSTSAGGGATGSRGAIRAGDNGANDADESARRALEGNTALEEHTA